MQKFERNMKNEPAVVGASGETNTKTYKRLHTLASTKVVTKAAPKKTATTTAAAKEPAAAKAAGKK